MIEELMHWLMQRAAAAEKDWKTPQGAWADKDADYSEGLMVAYNHVWDYINERIPRESFENEEVR